MKFKSNMSLLIEAYPALLCKGFNKTLSTEKTKKYYENYQWDQIQFTSTLSLPEISNMMDDLQFFSWCPWSP